jgi:hypothetical protein
MKSTIARFMLLAALSAGSAFSQQSDQPTSRVQQAASQDQGWQVAPGNDQANQPENQDFSSSKKHKTKVKREKKKKDKKQDQDSSSLQAVALNAAGWPE